MAGVGSNTEFEDFDDESVYNDYEAAILNLDTRNVVIDFNSDNARAVRNVDHCFMKEEVLEKKVCHSIERHLYRIIRLI